jgi:hypothetical protein
MSRILQSAVSLPNYAISDREQSPAAIILIGIFIFISTNLPLRVFQQKLPGGNTGNMRLSCAIRRRIVDEMG